MTAQELSLKKKGNTLIGLAQLEIEAVIHIITILVSLPAQPFPLCFGEIVVSFSIILFSSIPHQSQTKKRKFMKPTEMEMFLVAQVLHFQQNVIKYNGGV